MYYAGIGSRGTPQAVLDKMTEIATMLANAGYTLRSGGADGADNAFYKGCNNQCEIYIPWEGFNGIENGICNLSYEHFKLAESIHPAWYMCKQGGMKLHARNTQQILGEHLRTPVDFVICWTKNGEKVGGTATAIRLAESRGIPVYNIGNPNHRILLNNLFKDLGFIQQ